MYVSMIRAVNASPTKETISEKVSLIKLGPFLENNTMVAVAGRILVQVFLMFRLGWIKGIHANNIRDHFRLGILHLSLVDQLLQFTLDLEGNFLLLVVVAKDGGGILGARIVALTVLGGGIVKLIKESHEMLKVALDRLLEFYVQDLDVAGTSGAHLTVRRILHGLGIGRHESDLCILDAVGKPLLKVLDDKLFGTPIAAGAKREFVGNRSHDFVAVIKCFGREVTKAHELGIVRSSKGLIKDCKRRYS
jgi:hypothetical protein